MHWRRKWQPTPVFLPGESQEGGAWWAAVYGVGQSWTQLKQLSSSSSKEVKEQYTLFMQKVYRLQHRLLEDKGWWGWGGVFICYHYRPTTCYNCIYIYNTLQYTYFTHTISSHPHVNHLGDRPVFSTLL